MNERDRLRREIARRRKAATDKMRRLRDKGINLSGTELDPRRNASAVNNYNTKQLRSYLNDLTQFTDRNTTFLPGAKNAILSSNLFNEYKELEGRFNEVSTKHLEGIKDITIPHTDMTIGERERDMLSKRAQGDIFNRPYGTIDRAPKNIESNDALKRLSADLRRKLNRGYLPGVISQQRTRLNDLFLIMGNPTFEDADGNKVSAIDAANALSNHQFDIFYNYGGGANTIFMQYAVYAQTNTRQSAQYEENFNNDLARLFEWATGLPRNRARKRSQ